MSKKMDHSSLKENVLDEDIDIKRDIDDHIDLFETLPNRYKTRRIKGW